MTDGPILSVASQAANEIRAAIGRGDHAPGMPVSERALAAELGCSIASVRQGLLLLQADGLIRRDRRRRAEIVNFTIEEIRHRNEVRIELEALACRKATLTTDDVKHLHSLIAAMRSDSQADYAFHHFIWHKAGNPVLEASLEKLVGPFFTFVTLFRIALTNLDQRINAHVKLVDAVRAGSESMIRAAIVEHVNGLYQPLERYKDLHEIYEAVTGQ